MLGKGKGTENATQGQTFAKPVPAVPSAEQARAKQARENTGNVVYTVEVIPKKRRKQG
jgi:hypothetical protein